MISGKFIQAWTSGQDYQTQNDTLEVSITTCGKTALDAKLTTVVTSAESAEVPSRAYVRAWQKMNCRKHLLWMALNHIDQQSLIEDSRAGSAFAAGQN